MRAMLWLCGSGLLITQPTPAAPATITGVYTAQQGASSRLEVRREAGQYVVLLTGGSVGSAGPAAAADCIVRARGTLHGKTLVATFAPVETETFVYTQAQAARESRRLKIIFGAQAAQVVQADTFGYCGLGSTFVGHYRRQRSP